MFMHKSKKGFTIVELVIVIAVIAILAAVLIPTFSNLVKKSQPVRRYSGCPSDEYRSGCRRRSQGSQHL